MKVLLTSVIGHPDDPKTWSNAPAHLGASLRALGVQVDGYDSASYGKAFRAVQGLGNVVQGYPANAVAWFGPSRRRRAAEVAAEAKRVGADLVLTTGTLDAPVGQGVPYAIWVDNSWDLLSRSTTSLDFSVKANAEVDRLERLALGGAAAVLTFSKHLRDNIIDHYGVPADRVHAVGCGAGDLPPLEGDKDFGAGHLLFVAKHLFVPKGGDLVLEAFKLIRAQRPETKLVIVGSDEARTLADGIDGVEIHGFLERDVLNKLFYDAAMLVQPMRADPWGQVYLEAMKARTVVVSVNVAAVPELTEGGTLGVMADPPTPEALAQAVLEVYARPQSELDDMTLKAQARVMDRYTWDKVGGNVMAAIGPLVQETAKAGM